MESKDKLWDVAIIGAGAAGLMTAITLKRLGREVLLLDSKEKIGAKILMSGGTRCNVTNVQVRENDYQSEHKQALKKILRAFSSEQTLSFFEELGVKLIREETGKYFPSTHSAKTVLDAFLKELDRLSIELKTSQKISNLDRANDLFKLSGSDFSHFSRTVVLTTGGLSFPATGSDGAGYGFAEAFGHSLITTSPSLTPLETNDEGWKKLSGISLPVKLTVWVNGKKKESVEGSFLFTHFGFSGPAALDISRHWIRGPQDSTVKLVANFLPNTLEDDFRNDIVREAEMNPSLSFKSYLAKLFPLRFAEEIILRSGISANVTMNQLRRAERESIIRLLRHCPLQITGNRGYAKAEVTAGGIPLSEINPRTLGSTKQPGLFFAGEILDVDGRIGGFNFQWAWSSGYVAGKGVHQFLND